MEDPKGIKETDFSLARQWENSGYLEDDILIFENVQELHIPYDPRRMNFILVGLCTGGEARYRVDAQEQTLTPGHILVVTERHVVDRYQASPGFEGLCMMVSTHFFHEVISNVSELSALMLFSRNHPVMELTAEEQATFAGYFSLIRQKIGSGAQSPFRRDLIKTLLLSMFYDLASVIYRFQTFKEKRYTRADSIFTRFLALVEEHCRTCRRVDWYASQLNITPKYLSQTVKAASLRTPGEWIDYYVTMHLRVMLKNTDKSIKEIAEELHFPNQSFLGRYFKEHVGLTPKEYRKK